VPKGKGLTKRYRFSKKKLKVVPKRKGLVNKYKFNQEKVEVVSKGKGPFARGLLEGLV
jgi:2-hydroxy-3-keto-5-methylthiopentenyl-1-phosphate phosphatase